MYDDECNQRHTELLNLAVQLGKDDIKVRMLHIGSHGAPAKSYDEAVQARRGPTHMIIADSSVAYSNPDIRSISKPSVLKLRDGEVVDVSTVQAFNEWVNQQ